MASNLPNNQFYMAIPNERLAKDFEVDKLISWALFVVIICACLFLLVAAVFSNIQPGDLFRQSNVGQANITSSSQLFLAASRGWLITSLVRGAEILATMAASLLIFLIVRARAGDTLMPLLGLLIIAAIIVPTSELERLADAARGNRSEDTNQSQRTGLLGIPTPEASTVLARRVLAELEKDGLLSREQPPPESLRPDLARSRRPEPARLEDVHNFGASLGVALYRVEVSNIAVQIRQLGLDRILLELADERTRQNMVVSPSVLRRLRVDLQTLRDLGAVTQVYGNLAQVQPTDLGFRVLHRLFPEERRVRELADAAGITSLFSPLESLQNQAQGVVRSAPVTTARRPESLLQPGQSLRAITIPRNLDLFQPFETTLAVSGEIGSGVVLQLEAETPLVIDARAVDRRTVDPVLSVWTIETEGNRRQLGQFLETSDDFDPSSNDARVRRRMPAGTYLLQVRDFSSGSGDIRLIVRLSEPSDDRAIGFSMPITELGTIVDSGSIDSLPFTYRTAQGAQGVRFTISHSLRSRTLSAELTTEQSADLGIPSMVILEVRGDQATPVAAWRPWLRSNETNPVVQFRASGGDTFIAQFSYVQRRPSSAPPSFALSIR